MLRSLVEDMPFCVCAQCCTCNFCGCGAIFEFIFAGLGTAWWAVASVVLMQRSFSANNSGVPVKPPLQELLQQSYQALFRCLPGLQCYTCAELLLVFAGKSAQHAFHVNVNCLLVAYPALFLARNGLLTSSAPVQQLRDWRTAEWVVSWIACGLFALMAILSLFRSFAMCCGNNKY